MAFTNGFSSGFSNGFAIAGVTQTQAIHRRMTIYAPTPKKFLYHGSGGVIVGGHAESQTTRRHSALTSGGTRVRGEGWASGARVETSLATMRLGGGAETTTLQRFATYGMVALTAERLIEIRQWPLLNEHEENELLELSLMGEELLV